MQSLDNPDFPADWCSLWGSVSESLLGGLHHALNNRVAALSAISQVLGAGITDAPPLVASLAGEVSRIEDTVALLSHLRRGRSRAPEPVQVPELVASLTPLLAQHSDLKEIGFVADPDPGVLPVWAERDLLGQVFLALMSSLGLEAECSGEGRVRVSYRGDQAVVIILVSCEADAARPERAPTTATRLNAGAAAEALQSMRGTLRIMPGAGGPVGYELRLPTLLAARRAEASSRL